MHILQPHIHTCCTIDSDDNFYLMQFTTTGTLAGSQSPGHEDEKVVASELQLCTNYLT